MVASDVRSGVATVLPISRENIEGQFGFVYGLSILGGHHCAKNGLTRFPVIVPSFLHQISFAVHKRLELLRLMPRRFEIRGNLPDVVGLQFAARECFLNDTFDLDALKLCVLAIGSVTLTPARSIPYSRSSTSSKLERTYFKADGTGNAAGIFITSTLRMVSA